MQILPQQKPLPQLLGASKPQGSHSFPQPIPVFQVGLRVQDQWPCFCSQRAQRVWGEDQASSVAAGGSRGGVFTACQDSWLLRLVSPG
jgi:hypothetical protein